MCWSLKETCVLMWYADRHQRVVILVFFKKQNSCSVSYEVDWEHSKANTKYDILKMCFVACDLKWSFSSFCLLILFNAARGWGHVHTALSLLVSNSTNCMSNILNYYFKTRLTTQFRICTLVHYLWSVHIGSLKPSCDERPSNEYQHCHGRPVTEKQTATPLLL